MELKIENARILAVNTLKAFAEKVVLNWPEGPFTLDTKGYVQLRRAGTLSREYRGQLLLILQQACSPHAPEHALCGKRDSVVHETFALDETRSPAALSAPPSDIYDLEFKYVPRGGAWRWCEGACRLRANVSLTPRDISKDWTECASSVSCQYCSEVCFGDKQDQNKNTCDRSQRRALKYFMESHVIVAYDSRPAWVCHICFNRNRWNGGAGPMLVDEMWMHWYTWHEPSKCCC